MKKNTAQNVKINVPKIFRGLIINNWEIKLFALLITILLWAFASFHKF